MLAALIGTGVQLALLVLSVILITIAGWEKEGVWGKQVWQGGGDHKAAGRGAGPGRLLLRPSGAFLQRPPNAQACGKPVANPSRPALPPRPAGTLFVERGTIVTVFIICYALTSFVGG